MRKRQGSFVHCAWCGNLLYRSPYQLRRSPTFFCNKAHQGKWRFASGLKEKMATAYNPNALPVYYPLLDPSPDLAYIVGVLIGDGCVGNRLIRLAVKDKAFANSFAEAMNRINLPAKVIKHVRYDKSPILTTFDIQIRSSLFIQQYRKLNISALAKQFPISFTRGFYESEGSWGDCISFCNSDIKKLELVSNCLRDLNFTVLPIRQYIFPGKSISKNKKPMYRFNISKDKDKFVRVVSPCIKIGGTRRG